MQNIADSVCQDIIRLVPLSLVGDVACFVFYDHHPLDPKRIDITICTKHGELKEFYRRELVSNINLHSTSTPKNLAMMRNSKNELFYLVKAGTEFIIISTYGGIEIQDKIMNVDRFTMDDSNCYGEISLKVFITDDAVPLVFDDNLKCKEETIPTNMAGHNQPFAIGLKRKLVEAKYSVLNYRHIIQGYIMMRRKSVFQTYQDLYSGHLDSIYRSGEFYGALKIKTFEPWVKVCNQKLVTALAVTNEYNEEIEEVVLVLNSPTQPSFTYTTKQFYTNPHLKELEIPKLLPGREITIVAVLPLVDLNVTTKFDLNVAISFKLKKVYLMPVHDIEITSLDVLGDEFDSLSASTLDINMMIAVQSTSVRTDLHLRDINADGTQNLSERVQNLLIKYMHMTQAGPDVIIYKKSPYHAMNGTLMHFITDSDKTVEVTVYTRTDVQILALIHCIISAVPSKIIVTTSNFAMKAKIPELSEFDESKPATEFDYTEYAKSILKRTALIIGYLDWSMVEMSESKDPEIVRQVGFQIDLYACGSDGYNEFKKKMRVEEENGLSSLTKKTNPDDDDDGMMTVLG